jgi:hypothetical protein
MPQIRRGLALVLDHFDFFNVIIVLLTLLVVILYFPKDVQQVTIYGADEMIQDPLATHKVGNWNHSFYDITLKLQMSALISCNSNPAIQSEGFSMTMFVSGGLVVNIEGNSSDDVLYERLSNAIHNSSNCDYRAYYSMAKYTSIEDFQPDIVFKTPNQTMSIGSNSPIVFANDFFFNTRFFRLNVPRMLFAVSKYLEGTISLDWREKIQKVIGAYEGRMMNYRKKFGVQDTGLVDVHFRYIKAIEESYMYSIAEYDITQNIVEDNIQFLFRVSSYTLLVDIVFSLGIIYKEIHLYTKLRNLKNSTENALVHDDNFIEMENLPVMRKQSQSK